MFWSCLNFPRFLIRGIIKKFVDWCDVINTYKAMLTNFVGDIKQERFYRLWKYKQDTLIINHFIIKYILYGMVTRRSLRGVPWRSTTSLFFNFTLYTLIHFWLGTQKSNTNLNNLFFHEYQVCGTVEWNRQCFTKKESLPKPCLHNTLKDISFSYIHAMPRKT